MAQFDEEGYYYITGRKKRFLTIYGNRVNLDEIDRVVEEEFATEAVSTGIDDHMNIFITDAAKAEPIRNFVIKKTRLNPAAFRIIVITAMRSEDHTQTWELVLYAIPNERYIWSKASAKE